MTEATVELVRETRKSIRSMTDDTTAMSVAAFCLIVAVIVGVSFGSVAGQAAGLCYGVGTFGSLMFWIWMMLFARRAWLLSQAAFVVAADSVADEPLDEQAQPQATPEPEPEPQPLAPEPSPMEQITSDAKLMQLLMDMPTEKLQSIIDARSIRQQ